MYFHAVPASCQPSIRRSCIQGSELCEMGTWRRHAGDCNQTSPHHGCPPPLPDARRPRAREAHVSPKTESSELFPAIMIRRSCLATGSWTNTNSDTSFLLAPLLSRIHRDRFVRLLVMDHVLYLEREDLPPCATSQRYPM